MQNNFDFDTSGQVETSTPVKKTIGLNQILAIGVVFIWLAVLSVGYYFFVIYKEKTVEDAKASVLDQMFEIDDLGSSGVYKGLPSGLYDGVKNTPELSQKVLLQQQLKLIKPVDKKGLENADGKIGFVFIGESYVTGEFELFSEFISGNPEINQKLVLIDATDSNLNTLEWNKSNQAWDSLSKKMVKSDISPKQVQILWLSLGFTDYSGDLSSDVSGQVSILTNIIKTALTKYPDTKVIYLSSPRYSGFAKDPIYEEPRMYEAGFAVRELISQQTRGDLNFRQSNNLLKSEPALVWGPYIWNNDTTGSTRFSYKATDFVDDGVRLTIPGKQRYIVDLYKFWSSYEFSKSWFNN